MATGVLGVGGYVPPQVVTNAMLEKETGFDPGDHGGASLDAWARRHHGGVERRRADGAQATSDLAAHAVGEALQDAGITVADVDLLVLATVTSDFRLPPSAAVVQEALGFSGKFLQLDSACTGFMDAVECASSLLAAGGYRRAVAVAADSTHHFLGPDDWLGRSVFGDGAGAAVIGPVPDGHGFSPFVSGSTGGLGDLVTIIAGGSRRPFRVGTDPGRDQYLHVDFGEVNAWGVAKMVEASKEALSRANVSLDDVDWVVPHQASARMIRSAAGALGVPMERVVLTYPEYGNTVGSSLPLALRHLVRSRQVERGHNLLFCAVGAGMAWSAAACRWW